MYDIAIVGAGPAGSTVARLAGDGHRVLLLDRRRLDSSPAGNATDGPRKVCGGLLAPKAQRELARQGLGLPASIWADPQLFAVRSVDVQADLERLYQRFYVNVDRELLDRWLVSLVPERVERAFGWSLRSAQRTGSGVLLTCDTPGGGRASVMAKMVVGADGASSAVRRLLLPQAARPRRYAAVQAVLDSRSGDAFYGAIFDENLTDFYGWTIPKGDTLLAGIALPIGPETPHRFDRFVEQLRRSGFRTGPELRREAAAVVRIRSLSELATGEGSVALVGEAAGFVSPSSAEGISYALRSGRLLAEQLRGDLDGAVGRYGAACGGLRADIGARLVKSSAIYGPATRRAIMRSGVGAIREAAEHPALAYRG